MSYQDGSTGNVPVAVSQYDLLLALLPLPLLLGAGGAWVLPVPTAVGVALGGLPSALLLGYALFYRSPTKAVEEPDRGT